MTAKVLHLPRPKTHVLTEDERTELFIKAHEERAMHYDPNPYRWSTRRDEDEMGYPAINNKLWWLVCGGLWAGMAVGLIFGYWWHG